MHVAEATDAASAASFVWWCDHVATFQHADQPHWSGWLYAFVFATRRQRYDELIAPADVRRTVYDGFHIAVELGDLQPQVEARRSGPFSDWDVRAMALHEMNPGDFGRSPFTLIEDIVRMARFQTFVRRHAVYIDEERAEPFRRSAHDLITRQGVWMPNPLLDFVELAEKGLPPPLMRIREEQVGRLNGGYEFQQRRRLPDYCRAHHPEVAAPDQMVADVLIAGDTFGFGTDDELQRLLTIFASFESWPHDD